VGGGEGDGAEQIVGVCKGCTRFGIASLGSLRWLDTEVARARKAWRFRNKLTKGRSMEKSTRDAIHGGAGSFKRITSRKIDISRGGGMRPRGLGTGEQRPLAGTTPPSMVERNMWFRRTRHQTIDDSILNTGLVG